MVIATPQRDPVKSTTLCPVLSKLVSDTRLFVEASSLATLFFIATHVHL